MPWGGRCGEPGALLSHHVDELYQLQAHRHLHGLAVVFHGPYYAVVVFK